MKKLDNFRLDLDNARRLHNRSDLERVRHQQKSDNVPDAVLSKIQEHSTELEGACIICMLCACMQVSGSAMYLCRPTWQHGCLVAFSVHACPVDQPRNTYC